MTVISHCLQHQKKEDSAYLLLLQDFLRQTESMRQNISWGHGASFDIYKQWGITISGAICEQALAKKMDSYFPHTVNNFKGSDLHIDGKSIQVRSQLMTKNQQSYHKTRL